MKKIFAIGILLLSSSVYPMWSKLCFWQPQQQEVEDDIDFASPKPLSSEDLKKKQAAKTITNWWCALREHQALSNNRQNLQERWRARTYDERLQGLLKVVVERDEYWESRDKDERQLFVQEVRELISKPGTDAERRKDFVDLCRAVLGTGTRADAYRAEFNFGAIFDQQLSQWAARTENEKRQDAVQLLKEIYNERNIGLFNQQRAQQDFSRVVQCLQDPCFEFNTMPIEDWIAREIHAVVSQYPKIKDVKK